MGPLPTPVPRMIFAYAVLALASPLDDPPTKIEALNLSVDFSAFEDLKGDAATSGQQFGAWTGKLNGAALEISLVGLKRGKGKFEGLSDSSDVANIFKFNRANRDRKKDKIFDFEVSEPLAGHFGELPYAWFCVNEVFEGTKLDGHEVIIAGLVPTHGYWLEVVASEPLTDDALDGLRAWAAASIHYDGDVIDPNWTEEEVEERWKKSAPDAVFEKGRRQIVRTKYYIIFSDIGRGTAAAFGKKVDENYETIRDVFPFQDVEGQRLLPIFYFTQRAHYLDFWPKNGIGSRESADRSGGVASGDVYATYHQSVNASVHIHEQTHQIFRNRLRLGGGGSWFQEGVAEYMGSNVSDLGEIKRLSQKEGALDPFSKFMVVPSLLMSSATGGRKEGGSNAGLAYNYAGAIIEFAKHSKFGEEKFLEWVHGIGKVGRGDLPAIQGVTARIYGVTLEELEAEFRKYWKKRRKVKDWHGPAFQPKKKKKRR